MGVREQERLNTTDISYNFGIHNRWRNQGVLNVFWSALNGRGLGNRGSCKDFESGGGGADDGFVHGK
jgi:hypothetical protein